MIDPLQPACKVATVTTSGLYKIEAHTHKIIPFAEGQRSALLPSGRCGRRFSWKHLHD